MPKGSFYGFLDAKNDAIANLQDEFTYNHKRYRAHVLANGLPTFKRVTSKKASKKASKKKKSR